MEAFFKVTQVWNNTRVSKLCFWVNYTFKYTQNPVGIFATIICTGSDSDEVRELPLRVLYVVDHGNLQYLARILPRSVACIASSCEEWVKITFLKSAVCVRT